MRALLRFFILLFMLSEKLISSADTIDIWIPIFNVLPLPNQYKLSQVCKQFADLFNVNQLVELRNGKMPPKYSKRKDKQSHEIPQPVASFLTKIASNKLGGTISFQGTYFPEYDLFFESLKSNSCITGLTIKKWDCRNYSLKNLVDILALKHEGKLKSLTLNYCNFNYCDLTKTKLLTVLPYLEDLDVSNIKGFFNKGSHQNPVDYESIQAFATACVNLKTLSVINCGLTQNMFETLVKCLEKNQKPLKLTTDGNWGRNSLPDWDLNHLDIHFTASAILTNWRGTKIT